MNVPEENAGKICLSLEKYFDVRTGRIKIKPRPVLIIGCEENYKSPLNVDYEMVPISTMKQMRPDPVYDIHIDKTMCDRLGIKEECYIRSNKTTWNHHKRTKVEQPICDLRNDDPELFVHILQLNEQWVQNRNRRHL